METPETYNKPLILSASEFCQRLLDFCGSGTPPQETLTELGRTLATATYSLQSFKESELVKMRDRLIKIRCDCGLFDGPVVETVEAIEQELGWRWRGDRP